MTDKEFDSKISGLMSSHEEPVEAGMWEGIESGLIRRRRFTLLRRVGYSVAAAAAVVAGVVVLTLPQVEISVPVQQVALVQEDATEDNIAIADNTSSVQTPSDVEEVPIPRKAASKKASPTSQVSDLKESSVSDLEAPVTEDVPATSQEVASTEDDASSFKSHIAAVQVADAIEKEAENKPYKTISEQLTENGYIAMDDTPAKSKRDIMISASSNLSIANSSNNWFLSRPSYSAGGGSGANYGIVPIDKPHHYFPVSVALQLQFPLLDQKLGLGIGVNYTYLHSQYEALIDMKSQGDVSQDLHYLGIPVNLYLNIIKTDKLFFYTNIGGMVEKGLNAVYSITDLSGVKTSRNESISGYQWSANIGLGFEYRFINFMGIYIDPRLTYFFDCSQPYSIRTEQQLQFNLELGLRFHLF